MRRYVKRRRRNVSPVVSELVTLSELAEMGDGEVAYIKRMTNDQARALFPAVENMPKRGDVFSLHAADGTTLALTDSREAAHGHAIGDDLVINPVH